MSIQVDIGRDLRKVMEVGRFANWLGMSFNCWLGQHKGCWIAPENGGYACSCHCHPGVVAGL